MAFFSMTSMLLGTLLSTHAVHAQTFEGSGKISVLSSNSTATASPADSIGCLDAYGFLTLDNCATFTRYPDYPYQLSTSVGNCTFYDESTPVNSDSVYGGDSHAFTCQPDWQPTISDDFYTITGFNYPFLCYGDVDCFYDIKTAPTTEADQEYVWQYHWGSQQLGITPGHIQAIWLWEADA